MELTVEVDGMPTVYPGHAHQIQAPSVGINDMFYVMSIAHEWTATNRYRSTIS